MGRIYDDIYEAFLDYHPDLQRKVIDWYPVGKYEILVKLSDGSQVIFDEALRCSRITKLDHWMSETEWAKEFSARLQNKFVESGLTLDELSIKSNISRRTLSRYLYGLTYPSHYNVLRLSKALGCSIHELSYFN